MDSIIRQSLEDSQRIKQRFILDHTDQIKELAAWIAEAFSHGGKLFIFGNGGSAADAQHIAAEFVNRFLMERPPLPALALTTDTSILTSISNDYDFSEVFAKQIKALGHKGDIALGITTSGNSPNVVKGLEVSKELGIKTVALTGQDGGKVARVADLSLVVASDQTPRIQEAHGLLGHILCELVDYILFKSPAIQS